MEGLNPFVMKPCCHDLQRHFDQMLKVEYGCMDLVQIGGGGLDPFVISLVMKLCCHDSQRPFGQMLKVECGCLDLV